MILISKCCDVHIYQEKLELMGGKAKESGHTHGTSRWKWSLQLFYMFLRTLNGTCYVLKWSFFFFFFLITSVNVTLSLQCSFPCGFRSTLWSLSHAALGDSIKTKLHLDYYYFFLFSLGLVGYK